MEKPIAFIVPCLAVLLLLCPADASAPSSAPSPATGGLEAEETCLGIGTHTATSACVGNVALACLGQSAVTEEAAFLVCFLAGSITERCWAEAPKEEEHCIGFDFSEERKMCLALLGWACRDDSSFGYPGFIACIVIGSIKCAL